MSDTTNSAGTQYAALVTEVQEAQSILEELRSGASPDSVDSGSVYDEVDIDVQARYVAALQGELQALRQQIPTHDDLPDPSNADEPLPFEADAIGRDGALAVVIGHSPRGDMGNDGSVPPFDAQPRTARFEYYWNRDLAERIKQLGTDRGYEVEIFHRWRSGWRNIPAAYNPVRQWRPEATLELHFNGFHQPREGTETLYLRGNRESQKWAQALQDKMVALYGRKRSDRTDRGLKPRRRGQNGAVSLRQIHPNALIEPFFGDSPVDARLGIDKKQELAVAIIDAFAAESRHTPTSAAAPAEGGAEEQPSAALPSAAPAAGAAQVGATDAFVALRTLYANTAIDFPILKDISFAQWAHESDFGRSELASKHKNFGGMKWLDAMAPHSRPVEYRPTHDPDGRDYCGFDTREKFIAGYWFRLDIPFLPYSRRNGGWRRHAENADMFIDFIGPIWAPRGGSNSSFNDRYEEKVRKRLRQLRDAGLLPSQLNVS